MDSLPSEREVAEALLELLETSEGNRVIPQQAYQVLAEKFGLSDAALALQTSEGRSRWENRVRYARWALIKDEKLDASEHGVWKLRQLPPVVTPGTNREPTADLRELDRRAINLRVRGRVSRPVGQAVPHTVTSQVAAYVRDPSVKAWVLQEAQGRCELCDNPGPFLLPTG